MIAAEATNPDALIILENIGPVERLELPARPGTITVLRGPNGSGKSTALRSIDAMTGTRSAKLSSRDGTVGGFAEGFGVTIKVARNGANRRLNDCLVAAVEDRLDIAQFVDPGLKDADAADLRRLKAMVNLVGAAVSLDSLYNLVGGREQFEAIVDLKSITSTDPIEVCDRVKRDFETAARAQTSQAEQAHAAAVAKLAENDGIDLDAPHDSEQLRAVQSRAIERRAEMTTARSAWLAQHKEAQLAATKLAEAQRAYTGQSLEDAGRSLEAGQARRDEQQKLVERLESELKSARQELVSIDREVTLCQQAVKAAKTHQDAIASWEWTVNAALALQEPCTEQELADAATAVSHAEAAVLLGGRVRDAIARREDALRRQRDAEQHRKRAELYRNAAQGTLDVLAESVKAASTRIRFSREFRLLVDHPQRGECFFADLSHGERWALALSMVLDVAKTRGVQAVLAIPQEAWEGLDAQNRRLIEETVSGTDLMVFTAEASDDLDAPNEIVPELIGAGA